MINLIHLNALHPASSLYRVWNEYTYANKGSNALPWIMPFFKVHFCGLNNKHE